VLPMCWLLRVSKIIEKKWGLLQKFSGDEINHRHDM
jgi:hypothetical protein